LRRQRSRKARGCRRRRSGSEEAKA
jgi:hypothetical protein